MDKSFFIVASKSWILDTPRNKKALRKWNSYPLGESTEGRKFGTGLLLVSQRPSRLDETALSQCNTFLIFRLVNPRDQSFVEKVTENLSKADSRLLPGFGPGQGIVSGQAVRFPLVIKVDFDRELQTQAIGDENFLDAAKNWQESPEGEAAARTDNLLQELDGVGNVQRPDIRSDGG